MKRDAMPDEDGLGAEWRASRGRNYAEEGIPVIVGIETIGVAPPGPGEPGVAATFRVLADALAAAEDADPAAVIEVIAAREMRRLR